MNKYLFLAVILLFSMGATAQDMYKVTADELNVRATNSPSSKIIGFIPQNENVMVLDSSNATYFKVKLTNGEGWVSSKYLSKIASAPAVKKATNAKPVLAPTASNTNSANLIFIALIVVVMAALLFFIFKFVNSKPLMAVFTIVVLCIGYFCYIGFAAQKAVNGKYVASADAQYQSFDFVSKDSVVIEDNYADSLIAVPYKIDGDRVKFKQQENTFSLLISDSHTLIGEGFTNGTFKKK